MALRRLSGRLSEERNTRKYKETRLSRINPDLLSTSGNKVVSHWTSHLQLYIYMYTFIFVLRNERRALWIIHEWRSSKETEDLSGMRQRTCPSSRSKLPKLSSRTIRRVSFPLLTGWNWKNSSEKRSWNSVGIVLDTETTRTKGWFTRERRTGKWRERATPGLRKFSVSQRGILAAHFVLIHSLRLASLRPGEGKYKSAAKTRLVVVEINLPVRKIPSRGVDRSAAKASRFCEIEWIDRDVSTRTRFSPCRGNDTWEPWVSPRHVDSDHGNKNPFAIAHVATRCRFYSFMYGPYVFLFPFWQLCTQDGYPHIVLYVSVRTCRRKEHNFLNFSLYL